MIYIIRRIIRQSAFLAAFVIVMLTGCNNESENKKVENIVGIHILNYTSDSLLNVLGEQLPEISGAGINTIFLEVDYSFEFNSHPELRQGDSYITKEGAANFTRLAKASNINIIPQFQSLGHQSWAKSTFPLLTVYPELDLTPGAFKDNENIYCREWDPLNPRVNEIIFPMIDEIVESFDATGIHLGMDEVFLIDSVQATTYGMHPASVFAMVINQFHDHFSKEKGLDLYIWADRLINGDEIKYGAWESSLNNTWQAIDSIPKDIILADWHYTDRRSYESVDYFLDKGFRVLPASYNNLNAMESYIKYTHALDNENMLGHMFTTWHRVKSVAGYEPVIKGIEVINSKQFHKVEFTSKSFKDKIEITLQSKIPEIRYSLSEQGLTVDVYKDPIVITESTTISAQPFVDENPVGDVTSATFLFHKGFYSDVKIAIEPSEQYKTDKGIGLLVDGHLGTSAFDGNWAAFDSKFEATFDLGEPQAFSKVTIRSISDRENWILPPKETIILVSADGKRYEELHFKLERTMEKNIVTDTYVTYMTGAQFVRVISYQDKVNETDLAWLFIDEIIVE